MDIDQCQLSKLYAYNGLMLSSGTRIDGVDIDCPHRVIVVDTPPHGTSRPRHHRGGRRLPRHHAEILSSREKDGRAHHLL